MSRRPYIRQPSRTRWWLQQPRYIRYMLREISSLFICLYVLILIAGLYQLSRGQSAYEAFLAAAQGPAGITFAVLAIIFASYHTYTWFQVTPKAMPLMFGGRRVRGAIIVTAHWLGFVLVSATLWILAGS